MVKSVRTWLRFALFSAFFIALTLGQPAYAGHYTVSYSGGHWTTTSSTGPYSYGTTTVGGYAYYDTTYTSPNPDPSSSSCSGAISTVFTWSPDYSGEPPPDCVVVTETCNVSGSARGSATAPPTAAADNDLGSPKNVTNGNGPYSKLATCNGSAYTVYYNPGLTFSIPSRSPSCSGSVNKGYTLVNLTYTAKASPVNVSVVGATVSGGLNILIGQGCSASMSITDFTLQNYQWTVSGDTFKDYVAHGPATGSYSQITYMSASDWTQASPTWFWRSESGDTGSSAETITGVADVYTGGVKVATVTITKNITVWAPYYSCSYNAYSIYIDSGTPPFLRAGNINGTPATPGIRWYGSVIPPDLFHPQCEYGMWAFVQKIYAGRWYTTNDDVVHSWSYNSQWWLDTSFPYPFWYTLGSVPSNDSQTYGKADNDVSDYSDDSPATQLPDTKKNQTVDESFQTYMIYKPKDIGNGSRWVPLHRISWSWAANVNRPLNTWGNLTPRPTYIGPVNATEDARCKFHPIWSQVLDASTGTYSP